MQNARLCRAIGGKMNSDLTEEEGIGRGRAVNETVTFKNGP